MSEIGAGALPINTCKCGRQFRGAAALCGVCLHELEEKQADDERRVRELKAKMAPEKTEAPAVEAPKSDARICASPDCRASLEGRDVRAVYCSARCAAREQYRRGAARAKKVRKPAAAPKAKADPAASPPPVKPVRPEPPPSTLDETLAQVVRIVLDHHRAMALIGGVQRIFFGITLDRAGRLTMAPPVWS